MEKPTTLSLKNFLIRKLSVNLVISETIIEAVINHQYSSVIKATSESKSVEVSGFGKFIFNDKKAVKKMEKYESQKRLYESYLEDESLTKIKRRNILLRLDTTIKNINDLKPRLNNECKSDI